ncbi:xylulokinase [Rossellomorea marisflavi]|uniref:xylulokinase n=1 Tax=Rossellomorea marisflavi TaxID=189381 RepID=UPI002040097F|nr:xylulokinase [Rossellomorea marisflavi]MCM2605624.1 xylulokinase [Rossellomorea marisflavi]
MEYVIGVDLGTSAVKCLLLDRAGNVVKEAERSFSIMRGAPGHSEQDPDDWVRGTLQALKELTAVEGDVKGISFSGQMHGLVLLDGKGNVARPAILWNDTRTTDQCRFIEETAGLPELLRVVKNRPLEGFTLPKLLWVKENEPQLFEHASVFMLPKDYVRYRLTGEIATDPSDAAGTLLLESRTGEWSKNLLDLFGIPAALCPPIFPSDGKAGILNAETAAETGLIEGTPVFTGGADNACGAIGAGILTPGDTMCSIGTSGVIVSYEEDADVDYEGTLHHFHHAVPEGYYAMGVTLSAGHSLSWFRDTFAAGESFDHLLQEAATVPPGSNGLLFTPYLSGERTPHADALIRGSFIGMDASQMRGDFVKAVMEGITFSLKESVEIMRWKGKTIDTIVSIGGGAKSDAWLQLQADIFGAEVVSLVTEQGPGLGAGILAATGSGWFSSIKEAAETFIRYGKRYSPGSEAAATYEKVYTIYKQVYPNTRLINEQLYPFRKGGKDA